MSKAASSHPTLPTVEWDFSEVSAREVEACFIWEAAREWSETIPRLRSLEALSSDDLVRGERSEWAAFTGLAPAQMLEGKSKLLGTPWLLLPPAIRADCADYASQPFKEEVLSEPRILVECAGKRGEGQNLFCVGIDWQASDSRLIEEFARWLTTVRKQAPRERRGSNPRDRLKMLAAMRLLHHYTLEQAVELTTRTLGRPLYGKRPSWERARHGAFEAIFEALLYSWESENDDDLLQDELASYSKLMRASNGLKHSRAGAIQPK